MSDSDTPNLPSDEAISETLRNVVISLHKAGNTDEITVKRVRTRAETSLGLPAGYLKGDQHWKQRSHNVIVDTVDKYCGDEPASEPPAPASPEKPAKKKPTPKSKRAAVEPPRGQKRKAATPAKKSQKRAKAVVSSDEDSDEAPGSPVRKRNDAPKRAAGRGRKAVVEEDSEEEEAAKAPEVQSPKANTAEETKQPDSESELSSLIDESPVKKKRQKKAATEKRAPASKSKAAPKAAPKARAKSAAQDLDPDEAEIKRLQGWLVKCGVRKVWSKELARYDTPKEKIRHLKGMLKDVGMEGKFSVEKAARIKEERELARDLEAIQEQEKSWGKAENSGDGGRRRRQAAAVAAVGAAVNRVTEIISELDEDDLEDREDEDSDAADDSVAGQESSAQDSDSASDDDAEESE